MLKGMLQEIVLALAVAVLVMHGSATKLQTARTIGISGGATGTATSFNGTSNITIPVTALDPDKLSKAVPVSKGGTGNATGNAPTATKLQTARNIKLTGAVSGNANFDGSGNVEIKTTQANIAILTGTITMPEKDSETLTGQVNVNYPDGYTKDNCAVVSIMSHNTVHTDWWSTPMSSESSLSMLFGNGDVVVSMRPDVIQIRSDKTATSQTGTTLSFKIVLMKIS